MAASGGGNAFAFLLSARTRASCAAHTFENFLRISNDNAYGELGNIMRGVLL